MKKLLVILLMGLLVITFLLGCGKEEEPTIEPTVEETPKPAVEDTTMMEDTTVVPDTTVQGEATSEPEGH